MEQRADYSDLTQLWSNRNLHLNQEYIDYHLELNNNPQLQEISFVDKLILEIEIQVQQVGHYHMILDSKTIHEQ